MQFRIVWACLLLTAGLGAGLGMGALAESGEPPVACADDETCLYLDEDGARIAPRNATGNETGNETKEPEAEPEPEDPERGIHACEQHFYAAGDEMRFEFQVDEDVSRIEVRVDIQGLGDADVMLRDGANQTLVGAESGSSGFFTFDFREDGIGDHADGLWSLEIETEMAGQWFWQVSVEY